MRGYTKEEKAKITAGAVAALVITQGGLSRWTSHFFLHDKEAAY